MSTAKKKIIPIEVRDEYILGSGVSIGARGSYDFVVLRTKFDDSWIGLNKYATWTNALGKVGDSTIITALDLVDGEVDTYDIPVPAFATEEAGTVKVSFTGYVLGAGEKTVDSLANTVSGAFRVLDSNATKLDGGNTAATVADQLFAAMDTVTEKMLEVEGLMENLSGLMENLSGLTVSCSETFVGARGYYISAVYINSDSTGGKIYLTDVQCVPEILSVDAESRLKNPGFVSGYTIKPGETTFTVVVDENFDGGSSTCQATIDSIVNNVVTFSGYLVDGNGNKVTSAYKPASTDCSAIDDFSFMIPSLADIGTCIVRDRASAIGVSAEALGIGSTSFGAFVKAFGKYAHAQGCLSEALAYCSTAEGYNTKAKGMSSHAEGFESEAYGNQAHAEGGKTKASGISSHSEGGETQASGNYSHAEGLETIAKNQACHTEGYQTQATGWICHAEGNGSIASGANGSHGEGHGTKASGESSHTEGKNTSASAAAAHAEGSSTTASGDSAHAEGSSTIASGPQSHAEGKGTTVSGSWPGAHAEGLNTTASSQAAHAEGENSKATGWISHAEGNGCQAKGPMSHAEGQGSVVEEGGITAHAEGVYTVANTNGQHVQGKYNLPDSTMAHIVGGGNSENDRKNIHTIDWSGNAFFAGHIKIGNTIITEAQLKKLLALLG